MNKIKINKKAFLEAMGSIKLQMEHDQNCSNAFSIILPNDHVTLYDNSYIIDGMIDLLKHLTNDYEIGDIDKYSWIEYFIYELNFGEKYEDGMIKDEHDKIIRLKNSSDLYALLIKNNNK